MISKELRHKSEQLVCTWKTDVFSSMKNSTYDLNQKIEDVSSQNTFPSKQIFNSHVLIVTVRSNRDQQYHVIHKCCKLYGGKPFSISSIYKTLCCVLLTYYLR